LDLERVVIPGIVFLNSVATWRRRRRKVGMRAFVNKEFFNQSSWTTSKEAGGEIQSAFESGCKEVVLSFV
jgi:hypothetical protein